MSGFEAKIVEISPGNFVMEEDESKMIGTTQSNIELTRIRKTWSSDEHDVIVGDDVTMAKLALDQYFRGQRESNDVDDNDVIRKRSKRSLLYDLHAENHSGLEGNFPGSPTTPLV